MNVSLTHELEKFVDTQVKGGYYHSSSEVIRAALRLLIKSEAKNIDFENYKMWLNQEIQIGLDQATRGEFISSEQLKAHVNERRQKFSSGKK